MRLRDVIWQSILICLVPRHSMGLKFYLLRSQLSRIWRPNKTSFASVHPGLQNLFRILLLRSAYIVNTSVIGTGWIFRTRCRRILQIMVTKDQYFHNPLLSAYLWSWKPGQLLIAFSLEKSTLTPFFGVHCSIPCRNLSRPSSEFFNSAKWLWISRTVFASWQDLVVFWQIAGKAVFQRLWKSKREIL